MLKRIKEWLRPDEQTTRMEMLGRISEAATLLHDCGLLDEQPGYYVKKYVLDHPEINEALNRAGSTGHHGH